MNTNITRSGNTQRLRLQSIPEVTRAGNLDAVRLLVALSNIEEGDDPAELLSNALGEMIGLAIDHRIEECQARLAAFCDVIGHSLAKACEETGPRFNQISTGKPNTMTITESEGGEL